MALTKEVLLREFAYDDINDNISIEMMIVIKEDGVTVSKQVSRRNFCSDELDAMKSFLGMESGPEIDYLTAKWT